METFKNLADLFSKLGDIQSQTERIQNFLDKLEVVGDAGAGMVRVTMNGKGQVVDVKINKDLFKSEDFKMLEDLLIGAFNSAQNKVKETVEEEYKRILGIHPEEILYFLKKGGMPTV